MLGVFTTGIVRTDTFSPADAQLGMAVTPLAVPGRGTGRQQYPAHDPVSHAIREFSGGIQLMEDLDHEKHLDTGTLVQSLLSELSRVGRQKPHQTTYVSIGLSLTLMVALVTMAFNYGALSNRVAVLEVKTSGIEVVGAKLDALQAEWRRFIDRYEQREQQPANSGKR